MTSCPVRAALATGDWHEPLLDHHWRTEDATATEVPISTTHRGNTVGRRVDFFLVGKMAYPMMRTCYVDLNHPMVNHFMIIVEFVVPAYRIKVSQIAPTANFKKAIEEGPGVDPDDADEAWRNYAREVSQATDEARSERDTEKAWSLWNWVAERTLHACYPSVRRCGRAKGSTATPVERELWAPARLEGALNERQRRLRSQASARGCARAPPNAQRGAHRRGGTGAPRCHAIFAGHGRRLELAPRGAPECRGDGTVCRGRRQREVRGDEGRQAPAH